MGTRGGGGGKGGKERVEKGCDTKEKRKAWREEEGWRWWRWWWWERVENKVVK